MGQADEPGSITPAMGDEPPDRRAGVASPAEPHPTSVLRVA